jgi:alkylation response protein AidB-like acyl-CoA dehydrogenase
MASISSAGKTFLSRRCLVGTLLRPRVIPFSTVSNDEKETLEIFKRSVAKFVKNDVIPNINHWDENGRVPQSIFSYAADLGILGVGYPAELGGLGNDTSDLSIFLMLNEELCKAGTQQLEGYLDGCCMCVYIFKCMDIHMEL